MSKACVWRWPSSPSCTGLQKLSGDGTCVSVFPPSPSSVDRTDAATPCPPARFCSEASADIPPPHTLCSANRSRQVFLFDNPSSALVSELSSPRPSPSTSTVISLWIACAPFSSHARWLSYPPTMIGSPFKLLLCLSHSKPKKEKEEKTKAPVHLVIEPRRDDDACDSLVLSCRTPPFPDLVAFSH